VFLSLLDLVEEGIPYGRMHNFPQVFGLYADIDYECKKNPGPKRGIEKLIGPKKSEEIKTKGKDARNKTDVRCQRSEVSNK